MTKVLQEAKVCLRCTHEHKHLLIVSIYSPERGGEESWEFDKFYIPGMAFQEHLLFDLLATFYDRESSKITPKWCLTSCYLFSVLKLEEGHILLVVSAVRKCIPGDILSINWVNLCHYSKQKAETNPVHSFNTTVIICLLESSYPVWISFYKKTQLA